MTTAKAGAALSAVGGVVAVFAGAVAVLAGALDNEPASAAAGGAGRAASPCVVTEGVPGLSDEQAHNAVVIVSTTLGVAPQNVLAARIALMVAITESGLRNLGPGAGHLDSVGLFQQRASQGWGTTAEEMDPARATAMFVDRLLTVPDWSSRDPWVVAQQVQRSAFADGANYRASWERAGAVLAALVANGTAPGPCTSPLNDQGGSSRIASDDPPG